VERGELHGGVTRREDYDTHEATALSALGLAGVEPRVVQRLFGDFEREINAGSGRLSEDAMERLASKYAAKIGTETWARLRAWYDGVQGQQS
jgi:hypothetical protein